MVRRIHDVLSIICGHDGTDELFLPSLLSPSTAVHRGVLWFHHLDARVRPEGKCRKFSMEGIVLTNTTASQHHPHTLLSYPPTRLSGVVSDQLLPYGVHWLAPCHIVWCETSDLLDEWLKGAKCLGKLCFGVPLRYLLVQSYEAVHQVLASLRIVIVYMYHNHIVCISRTI